MSVYLNNWLNFCTSFSRGFASYPDANIPAPQETANKTVLICIERRIRYFFISTNVFLNVAIKGLFFNAAYTPDGHF